MTSPRSPEYALLLRAAAPPAIRGGVGPRPAPVDWARVVDLARWQRLSPLLWRYLSDAQIQAEVPEDILDELRSDYRETAARNMVFGTHVDNVLATLAGAGIPGMLLKGSALVRSVYPEVALRPMNDVDILVPQSAIREAQSIVEGMGYRPMFAALERDDDQRLADHFHHFPLVSDTGGVVLELHQHVTAAGSRFDIEGYWARARAGSGAPAYLLPSPEDLFLHVAIHFAEDRIARRKFGLGQLADLAWISARWPIDWVTLGDRAKSYGESDRLFLALMALQQLFGDIAPASLVVQLRPTSFRTDLAERFVSERILRTRPAIALEYFAQGKRRLFPGARGLEWYVRLDDVGRPSRARLRARQAGARLRKLFSAAPTPLQLVDDLRLSRWVLGLRRSEDREGEE